MILKKQTKKEKICLVLISIMIITLPSIKIAFNQSNINKEVINPSNEISSDWIKSNEVSSQNNEQCILLLDSDPKGSNSNLEIELQKNLVYRFSLEIILINSFSLHLDVNLISPTNIHYHIYNLSNNMFDNEFHKYFDFGAAETGLYVLSLNYYSETNVNCIINVFSNQTISQYYQSDVEGNLNNYYGEFSPDIFDFYDISVFNEDIKNIAYTLEMREGVEYWVNLIRTNPLYLEDINCYKYEDPFVTMNITLGNTVFPYYLGDIAQTTGYALHSNLDAYSIPNLMTDGLLTLRFGTHSDGNATIRMFINCNTSLNSNYAFLCYASNDIYHSEGFPLNNDNLEDNEDSDDSENDNGSLSEGLLNEVNMNNIFLSLVFTYFIFVLNSLNNQKIKKYHKTYWKGH